MSTTQHRRQQLLDATLAYAEAGWPVFPLRPGTKRPATPNHTEAACDGSDRRCIDGHVGWEARATLDPDRIIAGWRHRPYGIGIACGPANLLVVDLDTAKDGSVSGSHTLAHLEAQAGESLPATWTVGTPSGGRHLYYRQPEGRNLGNTAGRLGPGIDTRGVGGYVVAPPTPTGTGDYWLVDDPAPAELPGWFLELLTPTRRPRAAGPPIACTGSHHIVSDRARRYVAQALDDEHHLITTAPTGQRNHTLFRASIALGQLIATGLLDHGEAEHRLLDAADCHIAVGAYSGHQARQTITSGLRRGLREPRHLPTNLTSEAAS